MYTVWKVVDDLYRSAFATNLGIYARQYHVGTHVICRSALFPLFVFRKFKNALEFQSQRWATHERCHILRCETPQLLDQFPLTGNDRIFSMNYTISKAMWYASRGLEIPEEYHAKCLTPPAIGTVWCRELHVIEVITYAMYTSTDFKLKGYD